MLVRYAAEPVQQTGYMLDAHECDAATTGEESFVTVEPIKITRKHNWVAFATYSMTEEEAARAGGGERVELEGERLVQTRGPYCFTCEEMYEDAAESCPGDPRDRAIASVAN